MSSVTGFSFIDLFAGIGGFRIALEKLGGECRFSCEWDRYSRKTYEAWFGDVPSGNIRDVDAESIPDHDILAAGFPCQPFSLAGVSKKNSLVLPLIAAFQASLSRLSIVVVAIPHLGSRLSVSQRQDPNAARAATT